MPNPLTTLEAALIQRANEQRSHRLIEIKAMAPLLQRLEPMLPALEAQGLKVYPDSLQLYSKTVNGRRAKVLRLNCYSALGSQSIRWLQALQGLGFAEVERTPAPYSQLVLRKGHLLVQIDAPEDPVEAARRAQQWAASMAARACAAIGEAVPA